MRLPNFLIAGASRSGTTSLYHYLAQHPQIYMSPVKETKFFCNGDGVARSNQIRTLADYGQLFEQAGDVTVAGEASPQYLHSDRAPGAIRELLPEVRILFSLRNPADRAYRMYLAAVRCGKESRDPRVALVPGTAYVDEGFYTRGLERYLNLFDRSQIRIQRFEDFAADPRRILVQIFSFLNVDPGFEPDTSIIHNHVRYPDNPRFNQWLGRMGRWRYTSYLVPPFVRSAGRKLRDYNLREPPPLPADLRSHLLEHFRQDIEQLGVITGQDFSPWLDETASPS